MPSPFRNPRPGNSAPPYVSIERDESNHGWILQIAGNDRLGLLFAIAVVLSRNGVSLATAKIATLGERVEDVFLINGRVLENEEALIRIENELIDALNSKKAEIGKISAFFVTG